MLDLEAGRISNGVGSEMRPRFRAKETATGRPGGSIALRHMDDQRGNDDQGKVNVGVSCLCGNLMHSKCGQGAEASVGEGW